MESATCLAQQSFDAKYFLHIWEKISYPNLKCSGFGFYALVSSGCGHLQRTEPRRAGNSQTKTASQQPKP